MSGRTSRQNLLALVRRRDAHFARDEVSSGGEARLIDAARGHEQGARRRRQRDAQPRCALLAAGERFGAFEEHLRVEQQRLAQERAGGVRRARLAEQRTDGRGDERHAEPAARLARDFGAAGAARPAQHGIGAPASGALTVEERAHLFDRFLDRRQRGRWQRRRLFGQVQRREIGDLVVNLGPSDRRANARGAAPRAPSPPRPARPCRSLRPCDGDAAARRRRARARGPRPRRHRARASACRG